MKLYNQKILMVGKLFVLLMVTLFSVNIYAEKISRAEFNKRVSEEEDKNTKYLLAEALNKAKALQDAYGDFAPFGAGLFPDGKVKFVWLAKPGQVTKDAVNSIMILRTTLHQQAKQGALLGSAIAYKFAGDASSTPQVNIEAEYLTGTAKLVSTQYTLDKNKKVNWNNVIEVPSEPFVFKDYKDEVGQ